MFFLLLHPFQAAEELPPLLVLLMVANLTVGKKKYADVEAEMIEICGRLEKIRDRLIVLTDEDAKAFEPLSKAYGLPKNTPEEKAEKERILEQALYEASLTPMEIMKTVLESMKLLEILGEKGSRIAISDVGVGILFAQAALEGASLNVFINTFVQRCILFTVTYCVYRALGLHEYAILTVTFLQAVISVSVDMLPLPGGMGISETLYMVMFVPVFGPLLLTSMLLSRGISYYGQMLISALMTCVAHLTIGRKNEEIQRM